MARKRGPENRQAPARAGAKGSGPAAVEPVPEVLAMRYATPQAESRVRRAVASLGQIRAIPAQRLLLLTAPSARQAREAAERLEGLQEQGLLEFVTPLLRDTESRLHQVLTDEITVRFKNRTTPPPNLEKAYGVTVARQNEFVPNQFIVKVPNARGLKTLEVAKQLHAAKDVEFAAPNFLSEFERA